MPPNNLNNDKCPNYPREDLNTLEVKQEELENLSLEEQRNVITKAWKKMSLKTHPDKPGGSDEAFRKITEACSRLKELQACAH